MFDSKTHTHAERGSEVCKRLLLCLQVYKSLMSFPLVFELNKLKVAMTYLGVVMEKQHIIYCSLHRITSPLKLMSEYIIFSNTFTSNSPMKPFLASSIVNLLVIFSSSLS